MIWVFGYGSLMSDGWEADYNCLRRERARIFGYERSFTKASTVNWGSKSHPAPTLQVVPLNGGVCSGIAFEFDETSGEAVFAYLRQREGKGFECQNVALELETGEIVEGGCFFYRGKNVIADNDLDHIANMVLKAHGRDGTGLDYVYRVKRELDVMGIRDEATEALVRVIAKKRQPKRPAPFA